MRNKSNQEKKLWGIDELVDNLGKKNREFFEKNKEKYYAEFRHNYLEEIGSVVRDARKNVGLTQKELAKKANIEQSIISKIENGDYNPSIFYLQKTAKALGKRLQIEFVSDK